MKSPYLTLAPVPAGILVALVHHPLLAVPAGEADGAGAGVVLAGVEAGGPVVARPVVGAEVEVFVAHLTSPALRTFAGPRLGAGAVDTAGVDLAVLAQRALPALVTPETERLESWQNYGWLLRPRLVSDPLVRQELPRVPSRP